MEERRGWRERKGGEERDEKKRKKKQRRMKGASIGPQESQPSILGNGLRKRPHGLGLTKLVVLFPRKIFPASIHLPFCCLFFFFVSATFDQTWRWEVAVVRG